MTLELRMITKRLCGCGLEKQGQQPPRNPFEKPSYARIDEPYSEHYALGARRDQT